jgi:hypothetical protein
MVYAALSKKWTERLQTDACEVNCCLVDFPDLELVENGIQDLCDIRKEVQSSHEEPPGMHLDLRYKVERFTTPRSMRRSWG